MFRTVVLVVPQTWAIAEPLIWIIYTSCRVKKSEAYLIDCSEGAGIMFAFHDCEFSSFDDFERWNVFELIFLTEYGKELSEERNLKSSLLR